MTVGRLTQLIMDCDDAKQLATFWQAVLDLPEPEGDSEWPTLRWEPVGRFSFHRVDGYRPPAWPGERGEQHVHFDLLVADLHNANGAVEKAGARPLTDVQDPGPKAWQVFADPAGHPFCLMSVPE
ncbi:MAG: VOC family protein [Beijerinckiaceae bacterium]|nr:VOC family protein [Beijerinckiaceae bacterium]